MSVGRKRLNAVIIWMNCVCMEDRDPPPVIVDLHDIWKDHILRICKLVDSRTVVKQCENAKECYEIVHRTVLKVEEQRPVEDKGRTNCLSIHAAAKGVEIEIYKYLVLLINQLSVITKHDVIQRYNRQLKDAGLEEEFLSLVNQSKNNCLGDSWWICRRFCDLSDSVEDRLQECIEDNKMLVAKQIVCQQHILDLENVIENNAHIPLIHEKEKLILRSESLDLRNEITLLKREILLRKLADATLELDLKNQLEAKLIELHSELKDTIKQRHEQLKKGHQKEESFPSTFGEIMFTFAVLLIIVAIFIYSNKKPARFTESYWMNII